VRSIVVTGVIERRRALDQAIDLPSSVASSVVFDTRA
jgi:hypothetical protein